MSRRVYIALFAVLAELVAVAASGNQGVTDFVADHMATSPLGDLFLRSLPSFPWRVTTQAQSGATTILVSQYAAIATFLVLTFVLMLIIVRGAPTFSGPFFAGLCAVVLAALVAHAVGNAVDYDWDGRQQHTGLGRFGYSLFNSNDGLTIMFALMCGVVVAIVVGFVGVVLRRRTPDEPEAALFVPGAGLAGGYGAPLDAAGFGPTDYAPPTQPWQTTETYEPVGTGGAGSPPLADDPSLASYGTASQPEPGPAPSQSAVDPRAEWVPPPQPHPSFAYPPSYETGPLPQTSPPSSEPAGESAAEPAEPAAESVTVPAAEPAAEPAAVPTLSELDDPALSELDEPAPLDPRSSEEAARSE